MEPLFSAIIQQTSRYNISRSRAGDPVIDVFCQTGFCAAAMLCTLEVQGIGRVLVAAPRDFSKSTGYLAH